jgi:antitoxin VapB
MSKAETARVFRNGRSQAVRIPAAFRLTTDRVYIRRDQKTGNLTLSERPAQPSLDGIYAELDAAGAGDFTLDSDLTPPSDRESL